MRVNRTNINSPWLTLANHTCFIRNIEILQMGCCSAHWYLKVNYERTLSAICTKTQLHAFDALLDRNVLGDIAPLTMLTVFSIELHSTHGKPLPFRALFMLWKWKLKLKILLTEVRCNFNKGSLFINPCYKNRYYWIMNQIFEGGVSTIIIIHSLTWKKRISLNNYWSRSTS